MSRHDLLVPTISLKDSLSGLKHLASQTSCQCGRLSLLNESRWSILLMVLPTSNCSLLDCDRVPACRSELLRGPLYYVIVLLVATLAVWRTSPVPIVALALMCGGDGLADIAGRNIKGPALPHNPAKTWAGSIAMFSGAAACLPGLGRLQIDADYACISMYMYVAANSCEGGMAEIMHAGHARMCMCHLPVCRTRGSSIQSVHCR